MHASNWQQSILTVSKPYRWNHLFPLCRNRTQIKSNSCASSPSALVHQALSTLVHQVCKVYIKQNKKISNSQIHSNRQPQRGHYRNRFTMKSTNVAVAQLTMFPNSHFNVSNVAKIHKQSSHNEKTNLGNQFTHVQTRTATLLYTPP